MKLKNKIVEFIKYIITSKIKKGYIIIGLPIVDL